MRSFSPRALSSAFALVALALGACSDNVDPTEAARSPRIAEQVSSPTKKSVSISPLALSSNSLIISGDATVEVTVLSGSSKLATQSAPMTLVSTAFVTNVLFTDFNSGNPEFNGSNMFAAVQSFGYAVSPFPRSTTPPGRGRRSPMS